MPRISSIADMSVLAEYVRSTLHNAAARVILRYGNLKLTGSEFFLELLDFGNDFFRNYRIKFLALLVKQLGTGATLAVQTIQRECAADRAGFTLLRRRTVHICPLFDDVG